MGLNLEIKRSTVVVVVVVVVVVATKFSVKHQGKDIYNLQPINDI